MRRIRNFVAEARAVDSDRNVQLLTATKAAGIFSANLVIAGFVLVSHRYGYASGDSSSGELNLVPYGYVQTVAILLILIPIIVIFIANIGPAAFGSVSGSLGLSLDIEDAATPPAQLPTWRRIIRGTFYDEMPRLAIAYRVLITLATYLAVSILVISTGGVLKGPFGQFPIALVVIAPVIMTSVVTKIVNVFGGLAFVVVLYTLDGKGWFIHQLPRGSSYATWVYVVEAALVVTFSLLFGILQDVGRIRAARARRTQSGTE
jgi:hypothetical protein